MKFVLCSDPLNPRHPDEAYRAEVAVAERLGIPFALLDHDALANENDSLKAVRRVPRLGSVFQAGQEYGFFSKLLRKLVGRTSQP
jgi:hypothetical protein